MRDFRNWLIGLKEVEVSVLVIHAITHGERGESLKSIDGMGLTIDDILGTLNDIPILQKIPKLFFPNMCRGGMEFSYSLQF